jgi:hypothetical protein
MADGIIPESALPECDRGLACMVWRWCGGMDLLQARIKTHCPARDALDGTVSVLPSFFTKETSLFPTTFYWVAFYWKYYLC